MSSKVRDDITHPFSNFNDCAWREDMRHHKKGSNVCITMPEQVKLKRKFVYWLSITSKIATDRENEI